VPLVPLDSVYLGDAHAGNAPMIASTYTDFGGLRASYVFAYNRGSDTQVSFPLSDLGLSRSAYIYDYFGDAGTVVDPTGTAGGQFQNGRLYLVIAPVGPSGMAVLGDAWQFVSLGRKRITALQDDGTVALTVAFANGETSRTIHGYSPDAPGAVALSGTVGTVEYDSATSRFRILVMPGPDRTASIRISRPAPPAPAGTQTAAPPTHNTPQPHGMRLQPRKR
jgi:hypothetical protein